MLNELHEGANALLYVAVGGLKICAFFLLEPVG